MEPLFAKHVFVCLNNREKSPETSCASKNGMAVFEDLKSKVKALNLNSSIRINRSGCLGQCEKGLVMVIYPQGIWYQNVNIADVDEIIEQSLINDNVISRLQLTA